MTGEEFKAIRERFGLDRVAWMYMLGYQGNNNTMETNCTRYERPATHPGRREIPLYLAQYVWLVGQLGEYAPDVTMVRMEMQPGAKLPTPAFPEWETYYDEETT